MQKDFINGFKTGEVSIYNQETNTRAYRIESHMYLFKPERIDLIAYRPMQVVGKLTTKLERRWHEVTFEVLDSQTQQWKVGKFIQNYIGWYRDSIDIDWGGFPLKCEIAANRLAGRFLTDNNTILLAEFKRGSQHTFNASNYKVEIYSDDVPDAIYLLYVANFDEIITRRDRNRYPINGQW
ncbi:unnamed protein product [Rotaria sp. Silwood1]|nr:unnamed protein product [Rotaria sp. Silwood1]CAF5072507.1 unnamed protein product [Rotaria sp. Silwood1]